MNDIKKENLIGHKNAGFTITTQGKEAVLAKSNEIEGIFVAWSYHFENEKPLFYWGRYGDFEDAKLAFDKKERGEYSGE